MENKEKLHAEMVENEVDEKIRESRERASAATHEVVFDTRGITQICPQIGFITYDKCQKCSFYRGHEGFTVYCGYRHMPFAGTLGSKIETAVASIVAGDFSRVDFETNMFNVTCYVVDKIIRIDLKDKK